MLPALALAAFAAVAHAYTPAPSATLEPMPSRLEDPCAVVRCAAGTRCVVSKPGRAICETVPKLPRQKCGDTLCAEGLECCNALCGICVKPGMMCVQGCAIKPKPTAIVVPSPVLPILTLKPVVKKEAKADPKQCGTNVCGDDEECCNSSCGICVKKGGYCIEKWCGPVDEELPKPPKMTLPPSTGQKCGRVTCPFTQVCCNSSCSQCAPPGAACTMQYCGHTE